jgi:hypothetical protein
LRSSGMAWQHYRSLLGPLVARGRLDILNVPPAYGLQSRHCHPRWWHALPGMTLAPRLWFGRRWASDVCQIYQRALASTHLDDSAEIGSAVGREIEALCEGWVQPAQFR